MEHRGTVRLETERLILRPYTEADAQAVYDNWASDDEVTKYLTWPTHRSVDDSRGYMAWCVKSCEDLRTYQWGMERKDTHELIGSISVVRVEDDIDRMELGWVIGRRFWGQGYTPEAAKRVIAFLFEEVGAGCVCAGHDTMNINSGRVMQKAGMRYEGTLRHSGRNNRGIVDCCHYSILRSEWEDKHADA